MARSGVNRDQPGSRLQATGSWPDSRPQRRRFKRRASASSTLQRGRAIAETIETPSAPRTRRVLSKKPRKALRPRHARRLNPSRRPLPPRRGSDDERSRRRSKRRDRRARGEFFQEHRKELCDPRHARRLNPISAPAASTPRGRQRELAETVETPRSARKRGVFGKRAEIGGGRSRLGG